jgi:diketogulonate reductase-like aldo/keto reductase
MWLTGKGYAVLAKSSTPARIQSNIEIGGRGLSKDQSERIDEISKESKFKCEWDPHEYP